MSDTTPNMGLTVPTVGQTVGPTYAQEINTSLSVIDQHDHTTGSGVPIPASGININADLTFNGNSAIALLSTRYSPQGTAMAIANSVYVAGVDLYYNDSNGNQVRITQAGSVAGTPGSISNLVAPASASYSGITKTFTWQSDTNTPAHMDMASVVLRNLVASGPGLTLAAPTLSGNYTLTFPYIPPVNAFLGIDTSGNITTIASQSNGIGRTNLQAVGQIVSSATMTFGAGPSPATFTIATVSVTITSSGRPIILMAQPGSTNSNSMILSATQIQPKQFPRFEFSYTRGSATIATYQLGFRVATTFAVSVSSGGGALDSTVTGSPGGYDFVPPPFMDVVGAGTYVYGMKITDTTIGSASFLFQNVALLAYEL